MKLSYPAELSLACLCALLSLSPVAAVAENIVFPPNTPGVYDITEAPYYADNTGQTDVTDILNQALDDTRSVGDWGSRVLYFPNGTYLVSGEVSWKLPPFTIGPHVQGQSRAGTVIRLKDSTWVSPTGIGYVLKSGADVAQNFNRGLFNITVNTGRGNKGAIGVKWYANNEGLMSDVDIISEDGEGAAGLQIGSIEQGPCMARRVYVRGFRFGVLARPSLNSTTLAEISVEGQSQYGVYHTGNCPLYLDSLYSNNTVPAVYNGATSAQMVLTDAHLVGGDPSQPAMINEPGAFIFARNIVTEGYSKAIQSTGNPTPAPSGSTIGEYVSHGAISLFGSPGVSLNLPVKRAPVVAWEQDMGKWANIEDYTAGRSDAQALQAAIDDPAKTSVILPQGRTYNISGEVYVRGNISRIISVGADLSGGSLVVTDDGTPAMVALEKISGVEGSGIATVQRSSRTAVFECLTFVSNVIAEGPGDLFVTDVGWVPMEVTHPDARVWAWQFDAEWYFHLTVTGGRVRVFGWKDEGGGTSATLTGGATEILGFLQYASDEVPLFEITDAAFSIAGAAKCIYAGGYGTIVRETQDGVTRELLATDNPAGYPTEFDMPLYTSYDATEVNKPAPYQDLLGSMSLRLVSGQRLSIVTNVSKAGPMRIRVLDVSGKVVRQHTTRVNRTGVVCRDISMGGVAEGLYCIEVGAAGKRASHRLTLVR